MVSSLIICIGLNSQEWPKKQQFQRAGHVTTAVTIMPADNCQILVSSGADYCESCCWKSARPMQRMIDAANMG